MSRRALFAALLFLPAGVLAEVKASVADLAWLTGSWVGSMGPQTLEETWISPVNGTLACVVRLTSGGNTDMVELILIEDQDDTIVFRVRQWLPGFVPRDPPGQKMRLDEIGPRRVSFLADGPGVFERLTYSLSEDVFQIDAVPVGGDPFQIRLRPR